MMFKRLLIIISALLLFTIPTLAQIEHYYTLEIVYDHGELSLKTIKIEPSSGILINQEGKYIAEMVSFEGKIINVTFFDISTTIFYDYLDEETGSMGGGQYELNKTEFRLNLPYYPDAKEINIYDWDLSKKLTIDVVSYSREYGMVPSGEVNRTAEASEGTGAITEEEKISETEEKPFRFVEQLRAVSEKEETIQIIKGVGIGIGVIIVLVLLIVLLKRKTSNGNY